MKPISELTDDELRIRLRAVSERLEEPDVPDVARDWLEEHRDDVLAERDRRAEARAAAPEVQRQAYAARGLILGGDEPARWLADPPLRRAQRRKAQKRHRLGGSDAG